MSKSVRILAGLAVVAVAVALALGWRATSGMADIAGAQQARSTSTQPGISIQGEGKVKGAPDVMRLDIGVEVQKADVQTALNSANSAATKVISALRTQGVAAKDIQTTGLSINANYEYPRNAPARIKSYSVSNTVRALIRNLAKAGATIGVAAKAGGSEVRISGISFALEDNTALMKSARDAAFADAKAKAAQYAKAAGRPLGKAISINESVATSPQYAYGSVASGGGGMALAAPAMPIQAGQQELTVKVSVLYAFE